MANTNKKRTAVIAVASAAALVLSGTVAWNMATDQTVLNELPKEDTGNYTVKLYEDFNKADPWANKDVWATNEGDNPVIVRMRLEEFYDISFRKDATYNNKEGYSTDNATGNAIFNVPNDSTLTATDADSSTKLNEAITLHFGSNVMTMAAWETAGKPYADDNGKGYWVIDTDGWCYYTKALAATESTEWLLDDVDLDAEKLKETYKPPYELDYYINVRLQAMSADLADFGATDNEAQWTNSNDGRVIADTENDFENTSDQTISDAAKALVMGIENPDKSAGKAVTSVEDLKTVLADPKTDKVSLKSDLTLPAGEKITVSAGATKTINLSGKTLTSTDIPFVLNDGATLVVEGGTIEATANIAQVENSTLVLNDVKANTTAGSAIEIGTNGVVEINSSTITGGSYGIVYAGDSATSAANSVVNIKDSTISGILPQSGMTVNATNSTFKGNDDYAIGFNHDRPAKEVNLNGCEIVSSRIGLFKSDNSKLIMKNCNISITDQKAGCGAVGACIRSGDVTLDNVNVLVEYDGVGVEPVTTNDLDQYYRYHTGVEDFGYNALQIVLNGYEDINLTINGGSYVTKKAESITADYNVDSVFICEDGKDKADAPSIWNNTITVTGNPTFSPSFTFADSYLNTTVSK